MPPAARAGAAAKGEPRMTFAQEGFIMTEILVCMNYPCHRCGGQELLASLRKSAQQQGRRDVKIIESTCLGDCGNRPMLKFDNTTYGPVGSEEAGQFLSNYLPPPGIE